MKVDTTNSTLNLVETYVVKALETRTTYGPDSMIRDQEVFLPPHKYVFSLSQLRNMHLPLFHALQEWSESRELGPMLYVDFISRAPVLVFSKKCVFRPYNLTLEVGGQGWVVFSQSCRKVSKCIKPSPCSSSHTLDP